MRRRTWIPVVVTAVAGGTTALVLTVGPSAVAAGSPAVVQSPVDGQVTSAAGVHVPTFPDPTIPTDAGDVAMDIGAGVGTAVYPAIAYDGEGDLALTVAEVAAASCSGGGGGQAVRVNISTDGLTVGSVTYAHLQGVSVVAGDPVSPDAPIGEVGEFEWEKDCWEGAHVHLEWVNHDDWGCYVPIAVGTSIGRGERVGEIGGDFGEGQGAVCP